MKIICPDDPGDLYIAQEIKYAESFTQNLLVCYNQ
jgi:hypothetical protein